jgi:hypothetical protein
VPYYDVQNTTNSEQSYWTTQNGTASPIVINDGKSVFEGSKEIGFRTRLPKGERVVGVPDNVADPYSYFTSLNDWKKRTLTGDFLIGGIMPDKGHPWELRKHTRTGTRLSFSRMAGSQLQTFVNTALAFSSGGRTYTSFPSVPTSTLSNFGATWYARLATKPGEVSLATILGEVSLEKLPSLLPQSFKKGVWDLKGVGGDYLNVQFGWEPLLASIRDVAIGLMAISNGLFGPVGRVHRYFGEEPVTASTSGSWSGTISVDVGRRIPSTFTSIASYGTGTTVSGILTGEGTYGSKTMTRRWFEGNFIFVPKAGFDPKKYQDRFDALFDTEITPSVLWELAPWSWLVDWYADIGSAIRGMETAFSNRVMSEYAYAMEEVVEDHYFSAKNLRDPFGGSYQGPKTYYSHSTTTVKRRIRANPFGFTLGVNGGLNTSQLSILAALGLTKVRV